VVGGRDGAGDGMNGVVGVLGDAGGVDATNSGDCCCCCSGGCCCCFGGGCCCCWTTVGSGGCCWMTMGSGGCCCWMTVVVSDDWTTAGGGRAVLGLDATVRTWRDHMAEAACSAEFASCMPVAVNLACKRALMCGFCVMETGIGGMARLSV
jgi:hypothetical protein